MDPKGPNVQAGRKPDATSGSYRAPEKLKPEMVEGLDDDDWHELELKFKGDTVKISLNGRPWKTELSRPGFDSPRLHLNLSIPVECGSQWAFLPAPSNCPVNHVSTELLKIAGRLEGAGMDDLASRLVALAEKVSENDRLLTVAEAAKWLGCGRRTLDQLIVERRIPAYLIGGRYRIDKHQVLKETRLGSRP